MTTKPLPSFYLSTMSRELTVHLVRLDMRSLRLQILIAPIQPLIPQLKVPPNRESGWR